MRLFRYLDAVGAVLTIEQKALRVSRLHELNDPFEWRIGITELTEGVEHLAEASTETALRELSGRIGLICFSAVVDESVLWSHYADRHRGMVLELEVTDDPKKNLRMIYTDGRPSFRAGMIGDKEHMMLQIFKLIRQKSTGWAYEQEYRIYERLADCEARGGHYYKPLEADVLKRVIVGWKSSSDVPYVERALAMAGFSDVVVIRASMETTSYKIRC